MEITQSVLKRFPVLKISWIQNRQERNQAQPSTAYCWREVEEKEPKSEGFCSFPRPPAKEITSLVCYPSLLLHREVLSSGGKFFSQERFDLGQTHCSNDLVTLGLWWDYFQHRWLGQFFSLGFSDVMLLFAITLLTWSIASSLLLWQSWIIGILAIALVRRICHSLGWRH